MPLKSNLAFQRCLTVQFLALWLYFSNLSVELNVGINLAVINYDFIIVENFSFFVSEIYYITYFQP